MIKKCIISAIQTIIAIIIFISLFFELGKNTELKNDTISIILTLIQIPLTIVNVSIKTNKE